MRVIDRLAKREHTWRELDLLLSRLEGRRAGARRRSRREEVIWIEPDADPELGPARRVNRAVGADEAIRLAELYRAACADLMLAEAYDLPRDTVAYLHSLVGRAHNALYRSRGFTFRRWAGELFGSVPRRLRRDPLLRISAALFYVPFLLVGLLAAGRPNFAEKVVGDEHIDQMEQMYSQPLNSSGRIDAFMAGLYVLHNAGIGLRCYGAGLVFGVGSVYTLLHNGITLGADFGHMVQSPNSVRFYTFVTAHAPFELTAVVFSGAAGLRLGLGLVITNGLSRLSSLRRAAVQSLPTAGAAVFLFVLAAFLEGFVSASRLPYAAKALIALLSAGMLVAYLALGGRSSADMPDDILQLSPSESGHVIVAESPRAI